MNQANLAYAAKKRAVCWKLAEKAFIGEPRIVYTYESWQRDEAYVIRYVVLKPLSKLLVKVLVDADLVDGNQAYRLNDLLPTREARYAFFLRLYERQRFLRPRLPP